MKTHSLFSLFILLLSLSFSLGAMSSDKIREQMTSDELLKVVNLSPQYVNDHEHPEKWLGLFAKNATIEDPVGSGVHHDLVKFQKAFILPNTIRFSVVNDYVVPGKNRVIRDVNIHITTTKPLKVKTTVHAYLVYEMVREDGVVKIKSMKANWSLAKSSVELIKKAPPCGAIESGFQGIHLLTTLHPVGMVHYLQGVELHSLALEKAAKKYLSKKGFRKLSDKDMIVTKNKVTVFAHQKGKIYLLQIPFENGTIASHNILKFQLYGIRDALEKEQMAQKTRRYSQHW